MNTSLPLRISVLGGLSRLRAFCASRPDVPLQEAARLLANGPVVDAGFDYPGCLATCDRLGFHPARLPDEREAAFRTVIELYIHRQKPRWATALPYGRSQLARLLSEEELQCFQSAGLLEPNPSPEVILWWDQLALVQRDNQNEAKQLTGRKAELLSLEHERNRLRTSGRADLVPMLVALDDNSLGYDIRSYEPDGSPRYVEVKGCEGPPLVCYITRNEWVAAERFSSEYHIHIWDLSREKHYNLSPNELRPHIPLDRGIGKWQQVKLAIPFREAV